MALDPKAAAALALQQPLGAIDRKTELTVQVSTKLNRSHLVHGRQALILPCLGRTEKDQQRAGLQSTSVEDSMSMVHLSVGMKRPASPDLLSEPAIIAGMARAALPGSATPWESYVDDYDAIRDTMTAAFGCRWDSGSASPPGSSSSTHRRSAPSSPPRPCPTSSPLPARSRWERCAPTTSGTPRSTPTTTATAA